jgi:hypothetical protein
MRVYGFIPPHLTSHSCSKDSYCLVGLGYECQGHSAVVDMEELQQVRQMPAARLGTMVDEKKGEND